MPVYVYKCSKCGHTFDVHSMIKDRNDTRHCPGCNGPAGRDVETELNSSSQSVEDNPRWSWSMGATPQVAQQMLKKYPDLQYKFGKEGGPLLVRNRQEKKKLMKIHGMEEF